MKKKNAHPNIKTNREFVRLHPRTSTIKARTYIGNGQYHISMNNFPNALTTIINFLEKKEITTFENLAINIIQFQLFIRFDCITSEVGIGGSMSVDVIYVLL